MTISADTAVFAAFGSPVLIPELFTKNTVVAAMPAPAPSVVVLNEFVSEFVAYDIGNSVPALDTLETILTSNLESPFVASVDTPVTIPFKCHVNVAVVPAPGITTLVNAAVTPIPIVQP